MLVKDYWIERNAPPAPTLDPWPGPLWPGPHGPAARRARVGQLSCSETEIEKQGCPISSHTRPGCLELAHAGVAWQLNKSCVLTTGSFLSSPSDEISK